MQMKGMSMKDTEPPDSPPPPYPGHPQDPPITPTQHGDPDAYYQNPPDGIYSNYDPKGQQQQQQQPYVQQHAFYVQQQPGIGGAATSPRHVIITQPRGMTGMVEVSSHSKPQSYLALSMVTCLCFSPLFGLIAIFFSVASHSSYEHGDILGAKRHGTTALLICIFGIVLSLVILIIVLTAGVQWKPD